MLVKTQQELVEQRIEVRRQQQAIKNIQPLRIAIAHDPGFGVAGTQNGRQGQPGDRTRAPPIVQHGLAVGLLPQPLAHHAQHLGALRHGRGQLRQLGLHLLFERSHRLVGQRLRQRSGAAQPVGQQGFGRQHKRGGIRGARGIGARQFLRQCGTAGVDCHLEALPRHRHAHPCRVPGRRQGHMLRIARQHIFKAIVVTGFFDEGALQGVHGNSQLDE